MAVYPPAGQILSALGIEVAWRDDETLIGRALVDTGLLGRHGGRPGMGSLVPVVDLVAGSRASRSADNDWLATADVWMHERQPIESGSLDLVTRLLRTGRRSTVVSVEVSAGGRPAVSATVEFTRIRRDAAAHATRSPDRSGNWIRLGAGPLLATPIDEACGFRVVDAGRGVVEVDRSPFVVNSIGTLQGGVVALLADASAAAVVGPSARTVDLHFRFLDQTGAGPARTVAEPLRVDESGAVVKVEVVDASNDVLVGWATAKVTRDG